MRIMHFQYSGSISLNNGAEIKQPLPTLLCCSYTPADILMLLMFYKSQVGPL